MDYKSIKRLVRSDCWSKADLVGQAWEGEEEGLAGAEVGLPHAAVVLPVPLGPARRTVGAKNLRMREKSGLGRRT